ncbi:hypothetical protein BC936DRAFT_145625 [Jimgerdemannia flammicorona]|uniref:Uncharacterized protein n=1 Tax=Jimgerdemannia flammicorona TaxID=994334 RepID=A0A433D9L2_9FUNG|nr:hypothetical protein BC936DRAFT_145625 [Jimgerdemannia flammicorona]
MKNANILPKTRHQQPKGTRIQRTKRRAPAHCFFFCTLFTVPSLQAAYADTATPGLTTKLAAKVARAGTTPLSRPIQ